jgi:tryptophan 2,3-dioxygenase
MVERMIGLRVGTGGSPGVAYLDHTASHYRIFGRLLEARSFFIHPDRLPPLANPDIFRFRFQP